MAGAHQRQGPRPLSAVRTVFLLAPQFPSPDKSADGQGNYLCQAVLALTDSVQVEILALRFGDQALTESGAGWRIRRIAPPQPMDSVFDLYLPANLSPALDTLTEAAIALGIPRWRIIWRHIIPNIIGPVVIYITLIIPQVILLESFLSFIGLGINEPMTSLGVLLSLGKAQMSSKPWLLIFPALVMMITLLCLNFLGDGVRDAVDPKER